MPNEEVEIYWLWRVRPKTEFHLNDCHGRGKPDLLSDFFEFDGVKEQTANMLPNVSLRKVRMCVCVFFFMKSKCHVDKSDWSRFYWITHSFSFTTVDIFCCCCLFVCSINYEISSVCDWRKTNIMHDTTTTKFVPPTRICELKQ